MADLNDSNQAACEAAIDKIAAKLRADPVLLREVAGHLFETTEGLPLAEEVCVAALGERVECPKCGETVFPSLNCWSCDEWAAPPLPPVFQPWVSPILGSDRAGLIAGAAMRECAARRAVEEAAKLGFICYTSDEELAARGDAWGLELQAAIEFYDSLVGPPAPIAGCPPKGGSS